MAGFIIGFDGEKSGAGDRIVRFVERTAIPTAFFSMLQALPDTALWHRLEKEGRLRASQDTASINQTDLINFVPTRPVQEIAREYVDAFWQLYDPLVYLNRTYRHFLKLGTPKNKAKLRKLSWASVRALLIVSWRQGVVRKTRLQFWLNLFGILRHNPRVWDHYLSICAINEHFLKYRQIIRDQIEAQLADLAAQEALTHIDIPAPKSVRAAVDSSVEKLAS
jgi:radical SAM superfamily enzyme YgiQ (UPF0313 family)